MKLKPTKEDIDFVVVKKPLTESEKEEIRAFIKAQKAKKNKKKVKKAA